MPRAAFASLLALLTGCAGPSVADYAANRPLLDPGRFFLGKTEAWGMFQDRQGRVAKRFTVDMDGERQGDDLVLTERFHYSDGSRQQRVWRLKPTGDGRWRGLADDVVGEAVGETAGNALRWRYTLKLPVDGKQYLVQFDDWMFLQDERSLLNRAAMSKFGFRLGEVTLFFRKPEAKP
ncbi:DUF3833 domain-containing protein [Chromobacterium violaceum]|uniref:Protein of uncharacterized function (DUF3833) n=1 Tax=Chromobacterium violaceum TaxID=536 RepID=A0AAX2M5D0_CHRVL|nr:DUF3833 domain-containing protein [Chromobacterium violaceum]OLZ83842.1 hypothetical protein BS642_05280 [Chromobacterium violaceum]STB71892.1 Protein of uncharacterised function (DUF3833) [Chromobacterium violaceum]SUX31639.1 Protein of uncharacterised function (DUF3833) [Chromobacterium violaceum]